MTMPVRALRTMLREDGCERDTVAIVSRGKARPTANDGDTGLRCSRPRRCVEEREPKGLVADEETRIRW